MCYVKKRNEIIIACWMLEEHQTQSWSLAHWAEKHRGVLYLGRLPCEIIMNNKELVDYEIFVLLCT